MRGLDEFTIEVPSWAYGNSGTRFKVFTTPGVPRNPFEKIADAARVHAVTGLAPRVSLHIPWDRVDDFGALATHAKELGVRIGAINSNLFQDEDYKLGSRASDAHAKPSTPMRDGGPLVGGHPRSRSAELQRRSTDHARTWCAVIEP